MPVFSCISASLRTGIQPILRIDMNQKDIPDQHVPYI